MIRNLIDIPIVFFAGLLQRVIGSEEERESHVWQERLQYGDFFCGLAALLAAACVLVFGVLAWTTSSMIETKYSVRAAADMNERRYPQAVTAYQRLVEMRPTDRRYRYHLALAYDGAGEHDRAAGLMSSLAPNDADAYPQAQLWIVERMLAGLKPGDGAERQREIEARLIRLRTAPDVGPQATVLLVRFYFLTGRAALVVDDPTLRAAAESVPELHLTLLQASVGQKPPAALRQEAGELLTHFQAQLRDKPDDLAARRSAINAQLLLGDFVGAAQLLREGIVLHPNDDELRRLLSAAAVAQAQAAQLSATSPVLRQRLAADAVRALQASPQPDVSYTLRLAQMQRMAGDDADAERNYRLVVDKLPAARLELGEMLAAGGQRDDAAKEFERLLTTCEAAPAAEREKPENRLLAGAAAVRLERFAEAEKLLAPWAAKIPEAKALLLQAYLGTADAATTEPKKRLEALQAALKTEPFFQPALQRLLQPLGDDETNTAARRMVVDLAASGQAPASAYLMLGTDSILRSDPETAEKYFELALRSAPQSPIILNNLAWSLAFNPKPNLERALLLVETASKMAPNNPQVQDTHGRILAKLGRWKEALTQFQGCARAYDGNADFHKALSEVYEKLSLPELSRRHKERADEIIRREKESATSPAGGNKSAVEMKSPPPKPTGSPSATPSSG